jgi:hypothetical protein
MSCDPARQAKVIKIPRVSVTCIVMLRQASTSVSIPSPKKYGGLDSMLQYAVNLSVVPQQRLCGNEPA